MTSSEQQHACDSKSPLSTNLTRWYRALCNIIDINHGLFDEVFGLHVLSRDQIEDIRSKTAEHRRISLLLDYIVRLWLDRQKLFLVALCRTEQKHVNNYILSNGQRSGTDIENWPLFGSNELSLIYQHLIKIVNLVYPMNGLLDEMISTGCITTKHQQYIEVGRTTYDKNEVL
jgi:hypothetical protein